MSGGVDFDRRETGAISLKNVLCVGFFVFFVFHALLGNAVEGIDEIYLINLDRRQDRLAATTKELAQYGLSAKRFPAIEGKEVPLQTLVELGLPYAPGMTKGVWATTPLGKGTLGYEFLVGSREHISVFSEWMTIGAVGCALSHLTILREAYEAGLETIWVLEDDIYFKQDPHILTRLIAELDTITEGKWDVLYTDPDVFGGQSQPPGTFWWMWRPDLHLFRKQRFTERKFVSDAIIKVGSRDRTHSMVIRRSGMKKILDHIKQHHLFLPIDLEIAFAPEIELFMISYPIVAYHNSDSDIQPPTDPSIDYGTSGWELYKQSHLDHLSEFAGWCNEAKANRLMEFMYKHQPQVCVEIGTFGGSTTFPLIAATHYLNQGHVFTIDAWDNGEAVRGLSLEDPNYLWWKNVDLRGIKKAFLNKLSQIDEQHRCTVLDQTAAEAASQFEDGSIDLLYIDGNFSEQGTLQDVITYLPKVKDNGYIWLNDANFPGKLSAVAHLYEHAVLLRDESLKNTCIVFQKLLEISSSE